MGIYRIEEKGILHDRGYRNPPAGIANAGASDNRNVLLSVRDVRKVYGSREPSPARSMTCRSTSRKASSSA